MSAEIGDGWCRDGVWVSPGRRGGEPCVEGTRIPTTIVAEAGPPAMDLWQLTEAQVRAAMRFEGVDPDAFDWPPPYTDPIFTPGMVVADLDGGPDDRRAWGCAFAGDDDDALTFVALLDATYAASGGYCARALTRSDLPARLGVVDPATGRLNR